MSSCISVAMQSPQGCSIPTASIREHSLGSVLCTASKTQQARDEIVPPPADLGDGGR